MLGSFSVVLLLFLEVAGDAAFALKLLFMVSAGQEEGILCALSKVAGPHGLKDLLRNLGVRGVVHHTVSVLGKDGVRPTFVQASSVDDCGKGNLKRLKLCRYWPLIG